MEFQSQQPTFWDDNMAAQKTMQEIAERKEWIKAWENARRAIDDGGAMRDLAIEMEEESMEAEIDAELDRAKQLLEELEFRNILSGRDDERNAILHINAGAGGTEAQDWAEMLTRMYTRWAERHGYKVYLADEVEGDVAGVKSATLEIQGKHAYGYLKAENGVHRLVRISPYDSNARRHTSFASVSVSPVIDDTIEVDIQDKDVRTDTYRASGAGGQHINKTDSAVRLTHAPTGIVVAVQAERSQHKNRALAWEMLRARIYEMELKKREAAAQAEADSKTETGWGRQIRSYVLQPYQMVKDLRTGVETSDTGGVLDGKIDEFLSASLAHKLGPETVVEDLE